jgi:hypothetical protein
MANKRSLKRTISLLCEALFSECVAASLYGAENHTESANTLLEAIIKMQTDFTNRVSHPEPGMKPKVYFRILREQLAQHAGELADQISNL